MPFFTKGEPALGGLPAEPIPEPRRQPAETNADSPAGNWPTRQSPALRFALVGEEAGNHTAYRPAALSPQPPRTRTAPPVPIRSPIATRTARPRGTTRLSASGEASDSARFLCGPTSRNTARHKLPWSQPVVKCRSCRRPNTRRKTTSPDVSRPSPCTQDKRSHPGTTSRQCSEEGVCLRAVPALCATSPFGSTTIAAPPLART
jgi:hypothetical protein